MKKRGTFCRNLLLPGTEGSHCIWSSIVAGASRHKTKKRNRVIKFATEAAVLIVSSPSPLPCLPSSTPAPAHSLPSFSPPIDVSQMFFHSCGGGCLERERNNLPAPAPLPPPQSSSHIVPKGLFVKIVFPVSSTRLFRLFLSRSTWQTVLLVKAAPNVHLRTYIRKEGRIKWSF